MSDLLNTLLKTGSTKNVSVLSKSKFFSQKDSIPTDIPIINLALSGQLDGGLTSGLTFLAGESKSFKTMLGLFMVKAYMKKYKDAYCVFYDSEFGSPPDYVNSMGIDTDRVVHVPVEHVEQLKFDVSKKLEAIERGQKVIFFIDSVGNLASKKEADDALSEKSVADMTRSKTLKSLWRIVTPHLTTKDLPMVAINHTYQTLELYSKAVMSGGTGGMYSANQVFIITKAQEKEGTDLVGYKFTINIEKSRFVREKSKFPFVVTYNGGIDKWSGLLEIAMEGNFVVKPSNGWYSRVDPETGEIEDEKFRAKKNKKDKSTDNAEFWEPILTSPHFKEYLDKRYKLGQKTLFDEDEEIFDDDYANVVEDDLE